MRVLITGASGQLGRALLAAHAPDVQLLALTHRDLDISDAGAVATAVASFQPSVIINAAAYTAVDLAESEPERAHRVNVLGPAALARAAEALGGCRLLHVSTDYVFDGRSRQPYRPADQTNPLSIYGRTKLQGEQAVLGRLPERSAVLRTAWVYASQGKNFVLTMLRLMRERGSVRVVADQTGSPTAAASVAAALWRLAGLAQLRGIFHWTDAGTTSWYGFACAIAEEASVLGLLERRAEVLPIQTLDYPTPARRPECSVLDTRDSARQLGLDPVPWRSNLRSVLREVAAVC